MKDPVRWTSRRSRRRLAQQAIDENEEDGESHQNTQTNVGRTTDVGAAGARTIGSDNGNKELKTGTDHKESNDAIPGLSNLQPIIHYSDTGTSTPSSSNTKENTSSSTTDSKRRHNDTTTQRRNTATPQHSNNTIHKYLIITTSPEWPPRCFNTRQSPVASLAAGSIEYRLPCTRRGFAVWGSPPKRPRSRRSIHNNDRGNKCRGSVFGPTGTAACLRFLRLVATPATPHGAGVLVV